MPRSTVRIADPTEEEFALPASPRESDWQRLETVLIGVPMVIWEIWGYPGAAEQRIGFVSDSVESLLGYSVEEWRSSAEFWLSIVHPEDREPVRHAWAALSGEAQEGSYRFRWIAKGGRWIWVDAKMSILRDADGRPVGRRGISIDVTERKEAEEALQQLTARLLQIQDDERRRIAREIHDATGQRLLAINVNLALLQEMITSSDALAQRTLAETQQQSKLAMQELRTLSYLLHPPLLDQAGLVSALQWYLDGFEQRSGIQVDLVVLQEVGRLPEEVETALYRIVQECLTNIHRHSGSASACIGLRKTENEIVLQVRDDGKGMPGGLAGAVTGDMRSLGVGIPGMRERLRQLGGRLEIRSTKKGAVVTAAVPLAGGHNGDTHSLGR